MRDRPVTWARSEPLDGYVEHTQECRREITPARDYHVKIDHHERDYPTNGKCTLDKEMYIVHLVEFGYLKYCDIFQF